MQAETLGELLDRSRAAVMAGDFDALAGLAAETDAALQRFRPRDGAELTSLVRKAAQNAAMLQAAAAGLRAARDRLREIGTLQRSIGYDGQGRRVGHQTGGALTRRY